jgi:AraC-like DNA-binding protein
MPSDDVVHRDAWGAVGTFSCAVDDPGFADSGPTHAALFVFPRTAVTITHAGAATVVADRTTVVLYNRGAEYRRGVVSPAGDVCDWFALRDEAIVDAITPYDPSVADRADRPYPFGAARVTPQLYLRQRRLRAQLTNLHCDRLQASEARLVLLREVIALAYAQQGGMRQRSTTTVQRRHAELARAAQSFLANHCTEPVSLERLAAALRTSPFHLSRIFREQTGKTVHRYLSDLRLSRALELIADPHTDLARVAIDVGFATHSHFTEAFHATYGEPPSALRDRVRLKHRGRTRREQDSDSRR